MADAVKVTQGAFNSLLGLDSTKHVNPTAQPNDTSFVSRFTKSEMKSYLNRLFVKPKNQRSDVSASGIISYLKPIHAKIGNAKLTADKLRALAPEIEQSRILVSSSIMSPNDLQDGKFIFRFPDVPALEAEPDLLKEVVDTYDQYFNNTLLLGVKSYDWIGEAQYGSGAKAILILPVATQADLRNRSSDSARKFFDSELGFESFTSSLNDFTFSNSKLSWKDFLSGTKESTLVSELIPSMESFGLKVPNSYNPNARGTINANLYGDKYVAGIEDMIINLKTKLAEGDVIKITEDSEALRFHSIQNEKQKTSILDKLAQKYGWDKDPDKEELSYLDANPSTFKHSGHPTLIELPTEAVIPIIVPGAPSEHLGYFILLDNHGMPLTIENSGMGDNSTSCSNGSPNGAFEAMFGSNCCHASYFNKENSQNNMGNLIFTKILDAYIKRRMSGIFGRGDLELSRFNSLATVLFYRTLEAKQSTLVFVPPQLLHYFCFEYDRMDGTGKSKTAEIQFLLSLRTTLMMANVVGMVNDAIEHKKVEFGVDEKNANIEGIMDLIANIFIEKNKLNGSIDPSEIMRDMYSNALTIVPKNIPGLSELTVDVQNGGGQSSRVDDQLLEQITNLLVSHLDVPPAALNQMSEPEFAKSLVTQNLFFAKKIRRYQNIWCSLMTEFIRVYSSFDTTFQKAILRKLSVKSKSAKEKLPTKTAELASKQPNQYSSEAKLLRSIIDNVVVDLATPNIVVDKTQFEEISGFMRDLDELANNFFPNELVPGEDNLAQSAIAVTRAKWKKDQMVRFLSEVGTFNMVEVPDFDDMDPTEITDYIQQLQNVGSAIQRQREAIVEAPDDNNGSDDFGEGGDSFGGSDDSFGGSDGGESNGSDDFGGFGGESGQGGDNSDMFGGDDLSSPADNTPDVPNEEPAQNLSEGPSLTAKVYRTMTLKKK